MSPPRPSRPSDPLRKLLSDGGLALESCLAKMADRRYEFPHGPNPGEESLKLKVQMIINIQNVSLLDKLLSDNLIGSYLFLDGLFRRQNMPLNTRKPERLSLSRTLVLLS